MPVETEADRASFVLEDDFAEPVEIQEPDGTPIRTVSAIFDAPSEGVETENGEIRSQPPRLSAVRESDLGGIDQGYRVIRAANTYTVRLIVPDGTGMAEVLLYEV